MTLLLWMLCQDPIDRLVESLGAEEAEVREAAQAELVRIGRDALPALRRAAGDGERGTRAAAAIREIEWGPGLRAIEAMRDRAAEDPDFVFRLDETTSEASREFFPDVRVFTISAEATKEGPSRYIPPRRLILESCEPEPREGADGLNGMIARGRIAIDGEAAAERFAALAKWLGVHHAERAADRVRVERADDGYRVVHEFETWREIYTLRVREGVLESVSHDMTP